MFVVTYHVDELAELETHFDSEAIRVVTYGSNKSVVIAKKIVVEPLGIRIGSDGEVDTARRTQHQRHHHIHHLRLTPPLQQSLTIHINITYSHMNKIKYYHYKDMHYPYNERELWKRQQLSRNILYNEEALHCDLYY